MSWLSLSAILAIFALTCFFSFVLTGALRRLLLKWDVFDHPNERSSHKIPTPRGGGFAVMVVILGAWALSPLFINAAPPIDLLVVGVVAGITIIFWFEDVKGVSLMARLLLQAIATMFLLLHMGAGFSASSFLVFQGVLPPALDLVLAWGLWIWFINLFNFMDGIDGISVAEAVVIGLGAAAIGVVGANVEVIVIPAIAVVGAMAGFFIWNRPPAKIFLGDVGSISLGLLLGWMLLQMAVSGLWAGALILPLYYLADATITLLRRAARGEKFWHAHRGHFYQAAVQGGYSHGAVSTMVFAVGLILILLALAAFSFKWVALISAALLVGAFLILLKNKKIN